MLWCDHIQKIKLSMTRFCISKKILKSLFIQYSFEKDNQYPLTDDLINCFSTINNVIDLILEQFCE